jgi:hypothetical protein
VPRVAVVGCGDVSIVHFEAIEAIADAELVAVCERPGHTHSGGGALPGAGLCRPSPGRGDPVPGRREPTAGGRRHGG